MTSNFRSGLALFVMLAVGCSQAAERDLAACTGATSAPAAITACSEVIEAGTARAGDLAHAHMYRASARHAIGKPKAAIEDMDVAVRLAPGDAAVLANRGAILGMQNQFDAATRDLDAAMKLDPGNTMAIGNSAIVLSKQNRFAEARVLADRALALDPNLASMLAERCWVGAASGSNPDEALSHCNEAIARSPDANNFNSRGLAHYRRGNFAEAIADYDRSLEGDPGVASSWLMRGIAKRAAGVDGAQADIDKGKAMDANVAARYASYGVDMD